MRVLVAFPLAAVALLAGESAIWMLGSGGGSVAAVPALAAIGAACFVGLPAGGVVTVLYRAARVEGPARAWTLGALSGRVSIVGLVIAGVLLAGVVVAGTLARTEMLDRPPVAAAVDLGVAILAFALVAIVLRRPGLRRDRDLFSSRLVSLAAGAGGVVAFAAGAAKRDVLQPSGLWDLWTIGLLAIFGLSLSLALPGEGLALSPRWARAGRRALAAAAALALAGIGILQVRPDAREGIAATCRPAAWPMLLASLVDLDGDGFSGLLGGADCDDLDPLISPDAPETPGNGVDENCRGGDRLAPSPFPPRPAFTALPPSAGPIRHIVLVTIDTLRADHLGAYGYERPTSPHLDALARRGTLFRNAYTGAPYTRLAMPILMSGRTLGEIPWNRDVSPWGLLPGTTTFASLLADNGWTTHAIPTHRFFSDAINWTAGFEVDRSLVPDYQTGIRASLGPDVTRRGLEWQRQHLTEKTLLWIHLYDPHAKYMPHEGISTFGGDRVGLYDGEIIWTDRAIGELLEGLKESGIDDETAIIVLSDHGEEFGEHGGTAHGTKVFQELVRVPLIIKVPGVPPRRIACPTSTLDIAPTIANLAGIDASGAGFSGATLVGDILSGCAGQDREVVSELRFEPSHEFRTLIGERWKIVQNITNGTWQLYDLSRDPLEQVNARDRHPDVFRRLEQRLGQWTEHVAGEEVAKTLRAATVRSIPRGAMKIGATFANGIELMAADLGDRVMTFEKSLHVHLWFRLHEPVEPGCRIEMVFLTRRGKVALQRRHHPFSGLVRFERFPVGRIVHDVRSQVIRGKRLGRLRARVGIRCGEEGIAVSGPRRIHGRWVELGRVTAQRGGQEFPPGEAE